MKNFFKNYLVFLLFAFVSISPLGSKNVFAENINYFATTTNANCADYYHFGGVQIDVKPVIAQSVAGSDMNFTGYILNTNKYPVVSGKLFVKIFRERAINDNNGPDVLDTFMVRDGISLDAEGKMPIDFQWKIPAYAIGGNYKIATYFITSDKFNLAGLSFTDDVVGGLSSFKVKGEQDKGVFFKKEEVKINNELYHFASYPPIVSPNDVIRVLVPITNTTKDRQNVVTEFNVYRWDAQAVENKVDSKTEVAVVEPGKTIYLPIDVKDNKASVYYVEAVLKYMDSKSILGIRFVRDSVIMPRLNFPSILSYPLVAGQKNEIFSCFHNASNSNAPIDGKLKIEILSSDSDPILSYEYNGNIIGEMSAVTQEFVPSRTYKDFKIHATLFSGSKLVDEVYIPYSCDQISPGKCGFSLSNVVSNNWFTLILEIISILILLIVIVFFVSRFNKNKKTTLVGSKKKIRTFLFLIAFALFLSSGLSVVSAASTASGSGSGSGSGCITVTGWSPKEADICIGDECGVNKNRVIVAITGQKLDQVAYARHGAYIPKSWVDVRTWTDTLGNTWPSSWYANITSRNYSELIITLERSGIEWTPYVTLSGFDISKNCIATFPFKFVCPQPYVQNVFPQSGSTKGGEKISVAGSNLKAVKALILGNVKIPRSEFTFHSDMLIEFISPAEPAGWKDLAVETFCWQKEGQIIKDAYLYIKDEDDDGDDGVPPPPPPPPIIIPSPPNYNPQIIVNSPDLLYYWATTSLTSNLEGGRWAKALGGWSAQINYDSSVRYEDGTLVPNGASMPLLTKLVFNFDKTSTTSSSNISWNGTGYTEDTPIGSWVNNAEYPGNVCSNGRSSKNFVTTLSYADPSDGVVKPIDVFIPLAVNPPSKKVAFNVGGTSPIIVGTEIQSPDEGSWECQFPDRAECKPIKAGAKKVLMYYAPTYGYYYYGWKWVDRPNVCYSNNIALHSLTQMNVNNVPPVNDQGTGTCVFGSTNCSVSFGSLHLSLPGNSVVWCSILSPYYNPETNKCYSTVQLYRNSLHTDIKMPGSNVLRDYYQPYKLEFKESLYSLNLTINDVVVNRSPSDPVVTGPQNVYINTSSTYSAISNVIVAKDNSKSMFASVIFAVKKLFAQTQTSQVYYLFDWDNDRVADYKSPDVEYGVSVSASKTWSAVGSYIIAVRAVDTVSHKTSNWVTLDVYVGLKPATPLAKPEFSGTYCENVVNLGWKQVAGATRYFLQKNTGPWVGFDTTAELSMSSDTYQVTDYYNLYANRSVPDEFATSSPTTKLSATTVPVAIIEDCPKIATSSIPGIKRGLKFYPKPKWAGEDGKCNFWGSASTTITDDNNVNYFGVAIENCYVDSDTAANKLASPFPSIDAALLFSNNSPLKKSIGKHTLYCNVSYDGAPDPDTGFSTRATATSSIEATCTKSPTFIEK